MNGRNKHIWIFNAGSSYAGNPKWLMEYIVRHRTDISPVWMCYEENTMRYVRKLGYRAELYDSRAGRAIMAQAGVYVVEMCKEVFQPELEGITVLNLWHGVGCKSIERKVNNGFLEERIAKKYIQNNNMLRNNQLFLVTSELMEKHFKEQCGIDDDKVVCGGYPKCIVADDVTSYDHDIFRQKGLSDDFRLAVYAPTYRDSNGENFIKTAIPDMEKLVQALEKSRILLILKMHPLVERDSHYLLMKQKYAQSPYLYFWENENDIYEIFNQIDIAIVDYSSIFYDLLARGVKTFIRYFYDVDEKENFRDFVFDVKDMTCGTIASDFGELLDSLEHCVETDHAERERIHQLFWSYSAPDSCEEIIERALAFTPDTRTFPKLYSFDIFDTLFTRKCHFPTTIFECVQKKLEQSGIVADTYFRRNFTWIRRWCEANVREYYKKSTLLRGDDRLEIQLAEIYDRMAELYSLTSEQKQQLMSWECEAELDSVVPLSSQIDLLKTYLSQGHDVVLISDMYLPEKTIRRMLAKADPILAKLPLYLSSNLGYQKTTKKLFLEVYHSLDYRYSEWVHIGDNPFADDIQPSRLGIRTEPICTPELSNYEKRLGDYTNEYGVRNVLRLFVDFRKEPRSDKELFAYQYAALYLVPYVHWAISDAVQRGYETLYFISRDGHYLKQIADEVIRQKKLPVHTRYIYGSRKAWRIPSFIDEVDEEFFEPYGNFNGVGSFQRLLQSLLLSEEQFDQFFPELSYVKTRKRFTEEFVTEVGQMIKRSSAYRKYLLETAARQRAIVVDYLRQEIDFDEKFAFVEYWGRGYTQDCLTRLLQVAAGRDTDVPMYYVRSIYPTMGNSIRYNYTCNTHSVVFVESVFANLPYKTIESYERNNSQIKPVFSPCDNDKEMHRCLEQYLVQFARDFCLLGLEDEHTTGRYLFDFAVNYFRPSTNDEILLNTFSELKDAVALGERAQEYAPPVTFHTITDWMHGKSFHTRSYEMSMKKSAWIYRVIYRSYCFYCSRIRDKFWRKGSFKK